MIFSPYRKILFFLSGIMLISAISVVGIFNIRKGDDFVKDSSRFATVIMGDKIINAVILSTDEERRRGLSGKTELSLDTGMLFVFPKSDFYGIWMKDMLFPIDIVWLDSDFKIVHVEKNISPDSYPKVFRPVDLASYVLEINAGTVEKSGISVGQKVEIIFTTGTF